MKKKIALISLIAVALLLASCAAPEVKEFDIDFIVDGAVYANAKTDKNGIEMPEEPEKDDYTFDGWFWDEDVWEKPFSLASIPNTESSEPLRVYAKFWATNNDAVVSTGFYRLKQAYNSGILTYNDLFEISFYNNGDWNGVPDGIAISRAAYPKVPEFLSAETENKIKQTFLEDYRRNNGDGDSYTADDISLNYCGTYNGAVVVFINGLYSYTEALWSERVGGIEFFYGSGNYLRVFVEKSYGQAVPFQTGNTNNTASSREGHDLLTIVRSVEELNEAAATRYHQYWTESGGPFNVYYLAELTEKYGEEFFEENALLLYLFTAGSLGGGIEITRLQKQDGCLTVITDFHSGMAMAISYWTVAIEVAKADVSDITEIKVIRDCKCPPYPVSLIFVMLTPEATLNAYYKNKTYTPADFPEYPFAEVENLFTMEPNSPDFCRILFLHLAEPIDASDAKLLKAINLINQRADIETAGP